MITSKDIQGFIQKHWIMHHHCPYVCTNFAGAGYEEMDVIAVTKDGYVNEFEVKMSRADFLADFKKHMKHQAYSGKIEPGRLEILKTYVPNRFFYCCPTGLIKPQEAPEYAGLIYFTKFQIKGQEKPIMKFEVVKKAPIIHKNKHEEALVRRIARTLSQRMAFGCSLMHYQNKERAKSFDL